MKLGENGTKAVCPWCHGRLGLVYCCPYCDNEGYISNYEKYAEAHKAWKDEIKRKKDAPKKMRKIVEKVAKKYLDIDTLEARRMDSLDFHEVAVWEIRHALIAAYEAGKNGQVISIPTAATKWKKSVDR